MAITVGELSATVSINTSGITRAASQVDQAASRMEDSLERVADTARRSSRPLEEYRRGLDLLTRGAFDFNVAGGSFVTSAGDQASALDVLNKIGIESSAQIRAQITALDDLAGAYQNDAAITTRLAALKARLQGQLGETAGGFRGVVGQTRATQRALFALSGVVQGSTVSFESAAGSAVSFFRNLSLVQASARSAGRTVSSTILSVLTSPTGLAIAFGAIITLATVLGPKLSDAFGKGAEFAKKAKEEADKAKRAFEQAFNAVVTFTSGLSGVTVDPESIRTIIGNTEETIRSISAIITGLESARAIQAQQVGLTEAQEKKFEKLLDVQRPLLVKEEERLQRFKDQLASFEAQSEEQEKILQRGGRVTEDTRRRAASLAQILALQARINAFLNVENRIAERLRGIYGEIFTRRIIFGRISATGLEAPAELARLPISLDVQAGTEIPSDQLRQLPQVFADAAVAVDQMNDRLRASASLTRVIGSAIRTSIVGGLFEAADVASTRLVDTLFSAFSPQRRLQAAQLEAQQASLRAQLTALRENLGERSISYEQYGAQVNLINLEIAENQRQLARTTGSIISRSFLALADTIRQTFDQLLRDIAASFLRAGLVRLLGSALGVSTGGLGTLFLQGLGLTGGGAVGRVATQPIGGLLGPSLTGSGQAPLVINLQGALGIQGGDLLFFLEEVAARQGSQIVRTSVTNQGDLSLFNLNL